MATLKNTSGWKPWFTISTTRGGLDVPFGHFPSAYLPAKNFKVESRALGTYASPFYTLPIIGDSSSLAGLLGIIAQEAIAAAQGTTATFGLGYSIIPTLGFCIGDLYKEHTYFKYNIVFISAFSPLSTIIGMDVIQRSKLKRMYVHHGDITSININSELQILTIVLDYTVAIDPVISLDLTGYNIKIIKKNGAENDYPIKNLNRNFSIDIDLSSFSDPSFYPANGDYYQLSQPLCVEDPFMMSGTYFGTDNLVGSAIQSGYNLYLTDHNQAYVHQDIVGVYTYVAIDSQLVVNIAEDAPFKYEPTGTNEWLWIYLDKESEIYGTNPDRNYEKEAYYSNVISTNSSSSIVTSTLFDIGDTNNIDDWLAIPSNKYIRIELAKGGQAGSGKTLRRRRGGRQGGRFQAAD